MTSKAEFLSNIASRLGRERVTTPPPRTVKGVPDFWRQYSLSLAERVELFGEELEKLGGNAEVYHSLEQLHAGLNQLLDELKPGSIMTWDDDVMQSWQLQSVLAPHHVLVNDGSNFIQAAEQCMIGITGVDYAIANTGTLVLCTNREKMRSASLLPMVHIALVRAEQIKTRMGEVLENFSSFQALDAPSSIHFISGPSRSSDIENDLSIGVHGPVAVHVLILA